MIFLFHSILTPNSSRDFSFQLLVWNTPGFPQKLEFPPKLHSLQLFHPNSQQETVTSSEMCLSIPGTCWEQPGHFSPLLIPWFPCFSRSLRNPSDVGYPPNQTRTSPFPEPYKELGNSSGVAVPQRGGLGFSCLAQHSSHVGGGRGTMGWPVVTCHHLMSPLPWIPALGILLPLFQGLMSLSHSPSPLPALPQPCPRTQIGTGINFSTGFGCWWL